MRLSLSSAPASEPLTTANAKAHLRVDISDDDTLIDAYVTVARELVEAWTSQALISQTWVYYLDDWPQSDTIWLPRPPLQSVTSVVYTDQDGSSATLSSSSYYVDTAGKPGRIVLKDGYSWPSVTLQIANGIAITYVAGYGDDAADVPTPIVQALRLLLGDMYENRENSIYMPGVTNIEQNLSVRALLYPYQMRSELVMRQ